MKSTEPIYNGYSIRQILHKMPESLKKYKLHKKQYIKNCIEVHNIEKSGINESRAIMLRNANFMLNKFYLKLDGIIN